MTEEVKKHITRLINEFSKNRTTSSLVSFVAESNGMLGACRELVEKCESGDAQTKEWLESKCQDNGIPINVILTDIQDVVKLFSPGQLVNNSYDALGISVGASSEDIKRAYRKLSLRYHPDTSTQKNDFNSDKFIEISRAYHSLIGAGVSDEQSFTNRQTPAWRQEKRRAVSDKQRKKVYFGVIGLIVLFLIISIFSAVNYRKKTMVAGLQYSRGAFIPPTEKRTISLSAQYGTGIKVENVQLPSSNSGTFKSGNILNAEGTQEDIEEEIVDQKEDKPNMKQVISESSGHAATAEQTVKTSEIIYSRQESKKLSDSISVNPSSSDVLENDSSDKVVTLIPKADTKYVVASPSQEATFSESGEKSLDVVSETKSQRGLVNVEPFYTEQSDILEADIIPKNQFVTTEKEDQQLQNSVVGEALAIESQKANQESMIQTSSDAEESSVNATMHNESEFVESATFKVNKKFDLKQRIDQFFADYINAYNQRNVLLFTSYFEENAYENDMPFTKMLPIYHELFQKTSTVVLQINNREQHKERDKIIIEGNFEVFIQYKNNRKISGAGPIRFELLDTGSTFRIEALFYEFNQ